MPKARPEISSAELETLVRDVVVHAAQPLTAKEIHAAIPKGIRPKSKVITATVKKLIADGRLFAVERRYAAERDRSLHRKIVSAVAARALTESKIKKITKGSSKRVRDTIAELLQSGELHEHPKKHYSARPYTNADRLRPELEKLLATAKKKFGLKDDEARRALRELLSTHDPIVEAMLELNPQVSDGALLHVPLLRTALASSYKDKPSFDRAVLGLFARGTVQLQSHPTPSLLGAAEREAMIDDGRGGYYSAIGLR